MAEVFPLEGLDYLLDIVPRGGAAPTELWLGLFTSQTATTVPEATAVLAAQAGVTEVTGNGYARTAVPAGSWSLPKPGGAGRETSATFATFPPVGFGGWGTVNGFFLASAPTGGVAIFYANFDTEEPVVTTQNDSIRITPTMRLLP